MKEKKCCDVCGSTNRVCRTPLGLLCGKHYNQYKKHGKVFERTIRDRNEIIVDGDIARIITTDKFGNPNDEILIDIQSLSLVRDFRWSVSKIGYSKYAKSSGIGNGNRGWVFIHRLIMGVKKGDKLEVDHINGNGLDNRKCNLRIATHSQNGMNSQKVSRDGGKITGVGFDGRRNKYTAKITANHKVYYLGEFKTMEEAAKARREAELKYFGEFAPNHNKQNNNK